MGLARPSRPKAYPVEIQFKVGLDNGGQRDKDIISIGDIQVAITIMKDIEIQNATGIPAEHRPMPDESIATQNVDACSFCGSDVPLSWDRCPHCYRSVSFPNVRWAEREVERSALNLRYNHALEESNAKGIAEAVARLEQEAYRSKAVINRDLLEVQRLVSSDRALYATYYELTNVIRLPQGDKWDILRQVTDSSIFPGYHQEIRFAALTLDGRGLTNYGNCSLILSEKMIVHRSTVFEENTIIWMKKHDIRTSQSYELKPGYRAVWDERGKLAVAKLASRIENGSDADPDYYSNLLLSRGVNSEHDDFIEVHIYGKLSSISIETLSVNPKTWLEALVAEGIREHVGKKGICMEIAPWTL